MSRFVDQRIYRTFEEFEREELRRDGYFESVDDMMDGMFAGRARLRRLVESRSAAAGRRRRIARERAAARRARSARGQCGKPPRMAQNDSSSRGPAWIAHRLAAHHRAGSRVPGRARDRRARPTAAAATSAAEKRGRQGAGGHQDAGEGLQVRERVPRRLDQVGRPRVGHVGQLRRPDAGAEDDGAAGAQRARLRVRLRHGQDRGLPQEGSELPAQPEHGASSPSTW